MKVPVSTALTKCLESLPSRLGFAGRLKPLRAKPINLNLKSSIAWLLAHPLASLTVGVVWRVDEAVGYYVASISSVDPIQKLGINVNFRLAPAPELHIHELVAMDRPALAFVLDPFAHWVASIRFALEGGRFLLFPHHGWIE